MNLAKETKNIFLALLFILLIVQHSFSQGFSKLNESRISTNKKAMQVLVGWSLGNMAVYGVRASGGNGDKYFNQMNIYWNVVNLAIASAGYLGSKKEGRSTLSNKEILSKQFKTEKILFFNTGLDLAYIGTGFYLRELGRNENDSRWKGYGKSLILQGSFLAIFDSILILKHQSNRKKLGKYKILPASEGVGVKIVW